jgi:hypothetical protein
MSELPIKHERHSGSSARGLGQAEPSIRLCPNRPLQPERLGIRNIAELTQEPLAARAAGWLAIWLAICSFIFC